MELYEQIRREYEHGSGTIREVSRKLGVHRREVRKALASAIPAARKIPEREHPKLAPAIPFINAILEADRKAPENSATARIGSGFGCVARCRKFRWQDRRSVGTCTRASWPWGFSVMRSLCRSRISWAMKHKWIGMKVGCILTGCRARCTCSACAAWQAAGRFTGLIRAWAPSRGFELRR